jgi:hypothetical protein
MGELIKKGDTPTPNTGVSTAPATPKKGGRSGPKYKRYLILRQPLLLKDEILGDEARAAYRKVAEVLVEQNAWIEWDAKPTREEAKRVVDGLADGAAYRYRIVPDTGILTPQVKTITARTVELSY